MMEKHSSRHASPRTTIALAIVKDWGVRGGAQLPSCRHVGAQVPGRIDGGPQKLIDRGDFAESRVEGVLLGLA